MVVVTMKEQRVSCEHAPSFPILRNGAGARCLIVSSNLVGIVQGPLWVRIQTDKPKLNLKMTSLDADDVVHARFQRGAKCAPADDFGERTDARLIIETRNVPGQLATARADFLRRASLQVRW